MLISVPGEQGQQERPGRAGRGKASLGSSAVNREAPERKGRRGLSAVRWAVALTAAGAVLAALGGCSPRPLPKGQEKRAAAARLAWVEDYQQARNRAQREGKPLMVEVSAPWCSACKRLEEEVFSRAEIAAASGSFVLARVDGDKHPDLRKQFGVTGYPTVVFLLAGSKPIELGRVRGAVPYRIMLAAMEEAARKAEAAAPRGQERGPKGGH
jgi:thiol:disulfide interchange protein